MKLKDIEDMFNSTLLNKVIYSSYTKAKDGIDKEFSYEVRSKANQACPEGIDKFIWATNKMIENQ